MHLSTMPHILLLLVSPTFCPFDTRFLQRSIHCDKIILTVFLKDFISKQEVIILGKIAVIDLGSNSVRMSIFSMDSNGEAEKTFRSVIRLSEGMSRDNCLQRKAQLRAASALLEYSKIIEKEKVSKVIAVATAAVRKAKNKDDFLHLAKTVAGIDIKVIDGKTEAALDSIAVERSLSCHRGVICDIGGGSTELVGILPKDIPMTSIPYGSRGICEEFLGEGETPESYKAALNFVKEKLSQKRWLSDFCSSALVGIGGTLRAVAQLFDCENYSQTLSVCEIPTENIRRLISLIKSSTIEERSKMPGIGKDRADIIIGGVAILEGILDALQPEKVIVADVGVREGVFFDFKEGLGIL